MGVAGCWRSEALDLCSRVIMCGVKLGNPEEVCRETFHGDVIPQLKLQELRKTVSDLLGYPILLPGFELRALNTVC